MDIEQFRDSLLAKTDDELVEMHKNLYQHNMFHHLVIGIWEDQHAEEKMKLVADEMAARKKEAA